MYSYIKGSVEEIYIDSIVVENNVIGYKINVSSNTIMNLQGGEATKIYTKLIVREDDM
ncbi:OB-fold domain-containing protein, partial [Clostridioides difficile]|uniref:OB-fold domain-containing protein n=1 Tax=Clostridioides difficile TaxID=1496 RepID=UPI0027D2C8CD